MLHPCDCCYDGTRAQPALKCRTDAAACWGRGRANDTPTKELMMKKLLIGVVAIVVLIVVVAVAVPFFVPVDTYKDRFVERVKAATGRDLKIAGPVKFSILPVLGIEASQVSFSNAPGASTPEMMQLGKLAVACKLFPLLSGSLEIDHFVLENPTIDLEVDKQGRPNWVFATATPPAAAAPAQSAPAQAQQAPRATGAALAALRLDDVRLVNGKLSYLDQRTGQKQELTDVNLKLALPSLDAPFAAEGSVTWRGKAIKTTINVAKPRALVDSGTSDVSAKVASDPVNFDYKGKLTGGAVLKLDGPIDLAVPSVRGLAAWIGNPMQGSGSTFGALEIKGNLAMTGSKIGFTEAALSFDAIKAKGEFAFDGSGAKPYLQGKLDLDKLDVNPYLPPEGGGGAPAGGKPAGQPAPAAHAGWSDDPIDLSGLRAANADFALGVGALQFRKIQIGQSALGIQLKDGRMTADLSKLTLYQGNGHGKLMLDGSGAVAGLDASFNLAGVQVEPLLRDAAGFDRVTGAGAFDIAVNGHGHSQRELVGTLNGKGDLNFTNGVIKGLNLADMLKNVESAFGAGGGGGQTQFSKLSGTYTITNGILKNTDLDLQSPVLRVAGAGTADLPRRTLDYRVTPQQGSSVAGVSLAGIAVVISGPWDNLSYRPDLGAAAAQGAKELLKNAIPGAGGSKPGAIPGNLLNGLFKK
jgi:AsmA protein